MYGQLTTGRAAKVISKIGKDEPAYFCDLKIDTSKNLPIITNEGEKDWAELVSDEDALHAVLRAGKDGLLEKYFPDYQDLEEE